MLSSERIKEHVFLIRFISLPLIAIALVAESLPEFEARMITVPALISALVLNLIVLRKK